MIKRVAKKAGEAARGLREALDAFQRAAGARNQYDAGSRSDRLRGWRADNKSINAETRKSLELIRRRHRELVANHWAAARAKSVIEKNVVGKGVRPNSDDVRMEALLKRICNDTSLDPRGKRTLYAMQRQVMGAVVESGECLIVRQRRSTAEMRRLGLTLPLQLAILEADHIDTLRDGQNPDNGNWVYQGVEIGPLGEIVAYYIFDRHPGDVYRWQSFESRRVPAVDVIHPFDVIRPEQVRGLPWGISAMVKMRSQSEYEDAQLTRQKIAAAFAAFIHHNDQSPLDDLYDPGGVPEMIQPGTVEYLRPGEGVTFSDPPSLGEMRDFSEITARQIAAAYNVTYEALTNDYSRVNFSSGRMGWLEMQRHVATWQSEIMVAQVCLRVEEWIREAAAMVGIIDLSPAWKWTPPRREMIDPVRETSALGALVRLGLDSRDDVIQQLGRNPEDVDQEIAEGNARLDALGIIIDSDPRKISQAGQYQQGLADLIDEEENGGD